MPSKETIKMVVSMVGISLAITLIVLALWFSGSPLGINVGFVGVDNTTFIYVVSITPLSSPYWLNHSFDTVYGITAYTGNITVNCLVEPHPPITITSSTLNSPSFTLYITLLCPVAITNLSVNTTSGVVSVIVSFPN